MAEPLHLFIPPPIGPPAIPWTVVQGYGVDPALSLWPWRMHDHLLLETTGPGSFRAACNGYLSARPPANGTLDPGVPLQAPTAGGAGLPASVTLYLHRMMVAARAGFDQRDSFPSGGLLTGFAYLNVDPASLEAALGDWLDWATFPRGAFTRAQVVEMLVRGDLNVFVVGGDPIGIASSAGAAAGARRLGFAVLAEHGAIDPSYAYDYLHDFVDDGQAAVDDFLQMAPIRWPVIGSWMSKQQVLANLQGQVYAWPVLEKVRDDHHLTPDEWRGVDHTQPGVGEAQKELYRQQLLARVGHAPPGSTAPPFEFNDRDWQNLFQLEALVEFYINYPEPWGGGAPLEPGDAGYQRIDFLDPAGVGAMVVGTVVSLDGTADLTRVRSYEGRIRATITLDADTARATRCYQIIQVDPVQRTVEVDGLPMLSSSKTSWKITLPPTVVIVDSFGARLQGVGATATGNDVTLGGAPNLSKVDPYFDTIYFPSDTASERRTYRIEDVNPTAHTVTVRGGQPVFSGGTSRWSIQAGVGGELPALTYQLSIHDHYDGVAFVVHENAVYRRIRYSSYTSKEESGQGASSIRGNFEYDYYSLTDHNTWRNYSFMVVDPGTSADPDHGGDVRQARFYFNATVTDDSAGPQTNLVDGGPGKMGIRLHYGNPRGTNNDSTGCLVSPLYPDLRTAIVERYLIDYVRLNGPGPLPEIHRLVGLSHERAQTEWGRRANPGGVGAAEVDHVIAGALWLIRPDERPLGPG